MPRIALVFQGDPTRPGAWSGVLAGLIGGLTAIGCEIVPINAEFAHAGKVANLLGMSWAAQATSRLFAGACGISANRALRSAHDIDGVVMIGSGYTLTTKRPVVTFEDMTVSQAFQNPDPVYAKLSAAGARRWRNRQRQIYERSRSCCVTSHWAAESVCHDYGVAAGKVHVVGCGTNVRADDIDRDWSVPRFLFVGGDWERKRGAATLEAFAAVRRHHPDATLDLVGAHPPIAAPGVTGHGRLPLGTPEGQRRYAELLARTTCLLMPSTYEPFGIAYLDAAASGAPSIGTTVGGAPEAIGPGGRVVDPDDPDALELAMLELADPATASALGASALARCDQFTWEAVAQRVLRALAPASVDTTRLAPFLEQPAAPLAA